MSRLQADGISGLVYVGPNGAGLNQPATEQAHGHTGLNCGMRVSSDLDQVMAYADFIIIGDVTDGELAALKPGVSGKTVLDLADVPVLQTHARQYFGINWPSQARAIPSPRADLQVDHNVRSPAT